MQEEARFTFGTVALFGALGAMGAGGAVCGGGCGVPGLVGPGVGLENGGEVLVAALAGLSWVGDGFSEVVEG